MALEPVQTGGRTHLPTMWEAGRTPLIGQEIVPNAYVHWGLVVFYVGFLIPLLGQTSNLGQVRNVDVVLGLLWIAIGLFRLRIPLRLPFVVAMVLLLQAWSSVVVLVVGAQIGRVPEFNFADLFLVRYAYLFFMAYMLVHVRPHLRMTILWSALTCVGLSAVLGVVEWVVPAHVRPVQDALRMDTGMIQDRPVGFYGIHSHQAIMGNLACAALAGLAFTRRLRVFEVVLFVLIAAGAFVAQARAHLPGLALTVVAFTIGTAIHNRRLALGAMAALVLVVVAAIALLPSRMTVLMNTSLSEDPNLIYRKTELWPRAQYVIEHLPWTGTGSEPAFWGSRQFGTDKWASLQFDNGYLFLICNYGYIGLAIAILALGWAVLTPVLFALKKQRDGPKATGTAIMVGLLGLIVAIPMYANNVVTWQDAMTLLFLLMGLAAATGGEEPQAA